MQEREADGVNYYVMGATNPEALINADDLLMRVELFMKEMDDEGVVQDCISVGNVKAIINDMLNR